MSYLNFDDLRDELRELNEQRITCGTCKGEGDVEADCGDCGGDNPDCEFCSDGIRVVPCNDCDGEGERQIEDPSELDEIDAERHKALTELDDELGLDHYASEGEVGIPDDEFTEYAQQLAEDIGAVPDGNNWPLYCIDWERAADELRVDYTSFSFDGTDYLVRSI